MDGDHLNVVVEPVILQAARRTIEKYDIVPLYYEPNKAPRELLSRESVFSGLKRAHDYSGIGQVSNSLTKLWNKNNPDIEVAELLCFYNNQVIDAAKTGQINSYEQYPEVEKRISKAIGGTRSRMPYFFQFSKNGRHAKSRDGKKKSYAKPTSSTMNRICMAFEDTGKIRMNFAGLAPFNWRMLLQDGVIDYNEEAVAIFCTLDTSHMASIIEAAGQNDMNTAEQAAGYELLAESIVDELNDLLGDYRKAYPSIVSHLFAGEGMDKPSHKRMFWRVFGQMATQNIANNLETCSVCPKCGCKTPSWDTEHVCDSDSAAFFECAECGAWTERKGKRQCRCEACQEEYRKRNRVRLERLYRQRKKISAS